MASDHISSCFSCSALLIISSTTWVRGVTIKKYAACYKYNLFKKYIFLYPFTILPSPVYTPLHADLPLFITVLQVIFLQLFEQVCCFCCHLLHGLKVGPFWCTYDFQEQKSHTVPNPMNMVGAPVLECIYLPKTVSQWRIYPSFFLRSDLFLLTALSEHQFSIDDWLLFDHSAMITPWVLKKAITYRCLQLRLAYSSFLHPQQSASVAT